MIWLPVNQRRIDCDRLAGRAYWPVHRDITRNASHHANTLWARMQTQAPQLFVECIGWSGEQIEALEFTWTDDQGRAWFGVATKAFASPGSGEDHWLIVPEFGPVDFRALDKPPTPLVKIARAMEDKIARLQLKTARAA